MIKKIATTLLLALLPLLTMAQVRWGDPTIEALAAGQYRLTIEADIEAGWHIYDLEQREDGPLATGVILSSAAQKIGATTANQEPLIVEDSALGMSLGYFSDRLILSQTFKLSQRVDNIDVTVEWMACNDMSCMPPEELTQTIALPPSSSESSSLWLTILEAVLWGFAALVTPCIFPMVPMTISYFIKGEHGRLSALLYGIFIVLLYTLPIAIIILTTYLFGGEAVTANIFNWIATHWLPNILFFIIFVLFAASFFGLFEFKMPSSWINRSDSRAGRSSLGGIFFLALTLVLVSFSCTGPIVGSVLIKSTSGEFWQPIVTMFAFSVAFALPFVVISMVPTLLNSIPKSGGWLASVKICLGFLELALALKFLSVADQSYHWGILNRDIYLVIWIVIFTLMGLYLLGKLRFKGEPENISISFPRFILAIASLCFALYMVPGLWGAPLRPLSGYLPPMESQSFMLTLMGKEQQQQSDDKNSKQFVNNLNGFYDIAEAEAYAAEVGKPLLIDFTGHGCVNCRNMEQRVWSDERVDKLLREEYIIVALYMDDRTPLPEDEWITTPSGRTIKSLGAKNAHFALEHYGVNSQPYYILQDAHGATLAPARGYDLSVEGYIDFLEEGLRRFSEKNSGAE